MNLRKLLQAYLIFKIGQGSRPEPPRETAPAEPDFDPGLGCGCLIALVSVGIVISLFVIWAIRHT